MKKIIFFTFICLCFIGCSSVESVTTNDMFVDVSNSEDLIPFDSYVEPDYCEVIPLGKTSKPISQITKYKIVDNKIIIFDELTQTIFVFSNKGKPIFILNKFGNAKNEYLEISDFYYANGLIYVSDLTKRQIMIYDLKGKCVKIIDISNYWANGLFVIDNNIYLTNNGSDVNNGTYHIFKIDLDGKLIDKYLPFEKYHQSDCIYCTEKNSALCCQMPENIIYRITPNECEPLFSLNFDNLNLPKEYWNLDNRQLMQQQIHNKYIFRIDDIQTIGNKIVIFFLNTKSKNICAICDKDKGQVERIFGGLDINNNKYKARIIKPVISNESLFSIYEAEQFKNFYGYLDKFVRENVSKDYIIKMKKIADSIEPDSNPILFKYSIKKMIINK